MKSNPDQRSRRLNPCTLALALAVLSGAASAGLGTQTEDDVYVGKKRQVEGVTTPLGTSPNPKTGARTSPNTARSTAPPGAAVVPKNQVQGVNMPGTGAALLRPGAGTSPNTGRSAEPAPGPLPGK